MPNWCDNVVNVTHKDPKMLDRFEQAFNAGRLCDEFVPMPEELKGTTSPSETNEVLVEKYGASDWYMWAVNNWGTKWDVGGDGEYIERDGDTIYCNFQSAWSPPVPVMVALEELGFQVTAKYYEPGMGFVGVYEDGNEEYYDDWEDALGTDLDDTFGLTEAKAEMEENEDD